MKKFFQDDEQDLVNFLRQHRPLPPQNNPYFEQQVMNLIEQTSQKESKKHYLSFIKAIYGIITVGLAITWASIDWIQEKPQIAIDQELVESFLVSSWENMINEQTVFFSTEQEADWFYSNFEVAPQVVSHSQ